MQKISKLINKNGNGVFQGAMGTPFLGPAESLPMSITEQCNVGDIITFRVSNFSASSTTLGPLLLSTTAWIQKVG